MTRLEDITAQTIDEIVERGVCVCGAKIKGMRPMLPHGREAVCASTILWTSIRTSERTWIFIEMQVSYHDSLLLLSRYLSIQEPDTEWRDEVSHIMMRLRVKRT